MKLAFLNAIETKDFKRVYPVLTYYRRNNKNDSIDIVSIIDTEYSISTKKVKQYEEDENFFKGIDISDIIEENLFETVSEYVKKGNLSNLAIFPTPRYSIHIANFTNGVPYIDQISDKGLLNIMIEYIVNGTGNIDEPTFNYMIKNNHLEVNLEDYSKYFATISVSNYERVINRGKK